jgi:hypothetical protein
MAERDGMQKASNRQFPLFPPRTQGKGEVLARHPPIVKNPHKGSNDHPPRDALGPGPAPWTDRKNRLPWFFSAMQFESPDRLPSQDLPVLSFFARSPALPTTFP